MKITIIRIMEKVNPRLLKVKEMKSKERANDKTKPFEEHYISIIQKFNSSTFQYCNIAKCNLGTEKMAGLIIDGWRY